MIILIQNITNEDRYIYRFGGEKIRIPSNDFITFDCTDFDECNYWKNQSFKANEGIKIIVDPETIRLYNKLRVHDKYKSLIASKVAKVNDTNVQTVDTDNTNVYEPVPEITAVDTVSEPTMKSEVSETEDVVSDVVPVEPTEINDIASEDATPTPVESFDVVYTEDYLNSLTKEELFNILDKLNITYKRNNSVSTLVSLILENTKNED